MASPVGDAVTQARVPLMDLGRQHAGIRADLDAAVARILDSGNFILGDEVSQFETEVCAVLGARFAVGVASGTDALVLALRALEIGPGDEVIVPAFTFLATASAVRLVGATPVLVDVEASTFCIDPEAVERAISHRTRAVVPVHLFGLPADMGRLCEIASVHGLAIIEDNAQGIGATYGGQATGTLGDLGCLSFYPSKNLGALGDAGMVLTNGSELAAKLRMLRTHGWSTKYYPELLGQNSRLDALQAAILRVKLVRLAAWNDARRMRAERYRQALTDLPVTFQEEPTGRRSVYHLFTIQVDSRDEVAARLRHEGIETAVYYPYALHQVPTWEGGGSYPNSERLAATALSLPLFPEMGDDEQDRVVSALRAALVVS